MVEGVSPSTRNPPQCSRRERPKDLAALQANNVFQRRSQACLTESRAGLRFRQLTHEIFATQHHQTRSAAPWANQLRVVFLLASCLLQSCYIVVSTLATSTPIPSDRRHQGCVHCELRAMEQRKSVCHNLNLPVIGRGKRSRSATRTLTETLSPASRQTRAAALSNGNPRRPNTLARPQADRWWPRTSRGRPHQQK